MQEQIGPRSGPAASWADVFAAMDRRTPLIESLAPAERVVALHLRQGLSNREIAAALGKTEATVKHLVRACLKKCGAKNRIQLITLLR